MDEIENHQTRISVALDRVSRLLDAHSENASFGQEDVGLRARDAELIEELEATLKDERADLDAERRMNEQLKNRLVQFEQDTDAAKAAQLQAESAREELDASFQAAETGRQVAEAAAQDAEAARQQAETALREARSAATRLERDLARRDKEQERAANSSSHLEEKVERLNTRIVNQDVQFQRLKDANAQLRESNALLRARNLEMLGDAAAIDQSMLAELDALKTTRAADVDEMDTILQELKPLVEGKINAGS
jgi:chromosome segregation ATPase